MNFIKMYIVPAQHNSHMIKYYNSIWRRKRKVNGRLIILWLDGNR